jgi:hypothetical protein
MKDVRSLLGEADPLRREPELSESDVARMRSAVVNAARHSQVAPRFWSSALAMAAVVVFAVIAGTLGGRNLPTRQASSQIEPAMAQPAHANAERRQVQFATPGGTRIIWTIDPAFQLQEGKQ